MERTHEQKPDAAKDGKLARRSITAERGASHDWPMQRETNLASDPALAEVRATLLAGDYREGLALLRRLAASRPRAFWRSGRWRLWEQVGVGLREESRDPSAAAEAFAVLHDLRPAHVPTLLRLGEAWASAGEYGRAFHAYYDALELDPAEARAYFLLGALYGDSDDLSRARRYLERAVALAPRAGEHWAALGYVLQATGEGRRALSCYEKAARLLPKDAAVWNALGLLYAQSGEPRRGIAALRRGLSLKPDDPGILLNLSTIYGRDVEDFPRALRYARRLIELEPENAGAHHNLGLIHWALGEIEAAQDHLRRALEAGSTAPEVWASYNAFRRFLEKG